MYGGMVDPQNDLIILCKKYISHRSPVTKKAFYLKPLQCPRGTVWYADQAVGVNTIAIVVKNLMQLKVESANVYTNPSLRRTAVCRLNQSGFDIESVKKRTGHNTNEGVMTYDVVDKSKIAAQCYDLYGNNKKTNDETVENVMKQKTDSLFCGAIIRNCTFKFYFNSSNP